MSPFLPWLLIHHWPSENVNRACSLDTVGTSGSMSSTGPRPARAPDVRVSATEEPVTSRSAGTGDRLASMIVVRPAATVGPEPGPDPEPRAEPESGPDPESEPGPGSC